MVFPRLAALNVGNTPEMETVALCYGAARFSGGQSLFDIFRNLWRYFRAGLCVVFDRKNDAKCRASLYLKNASPRFATANCLNDGTINAVCLGQNIRGYAGNSPLKHLYDFFFCQFGRRIFRSLSHSFKHSSAPYWVGSHIGIFHSPLIRRVLHVVRGRAKKEMSWVYAARRVAVVADMSAARNRAFEGFICEPMGVNACSLDAECTVSAGPNRLDPKPASGFGVDNVATLKAAECGSFSHWRGVYSTSKTIAIGG